MNISQTKDPVINWHITEACNYSCHSIQTPSTVKAQKMIYRTHRIETIRQALLVTFDFTQRGKSGTGFAAASLLSACRAHKQYGKRFIIDHLPIGMPTNIKQGLSDEGVARSISETVDLTRLDYLALACYIWSSDLIEGVIERCRNYGFRGKVILGGYQINSDTCTKLYPSGDYYIIGYAEVALPEAILDVSLISNKIINEPVSFESLPSPYLDDTLDLNYGQEMIHWESRRGCVFKCNFCAHRDVQKGKVYLLGMEKIRKELNLFANMNIKKINVLDPVFNLELNHLEILKYAIEIGLKSLLSLQVRFEMITEEFLQLCKQLNVHLEFGLQTVIKEEFNLIKRSNNMTQVNASIELLHKWKQSFEVSLIYGLPKQTLASFKESIRYLTDRKVKTIKAFPLMLLEGTQLAKDKEKYNIVEGIIDESKIPHVIQCDSFSQNEWGGMHELANLLKVAKGTI